MRERFVELESAALAGHVTEVLSLRGREALGEPFRYELRVLLPHGGLPPEDASRLFDSPAHLRFVEDGVALREVFGLVSDVVLEQDPESARTVLSLTVVPRLQELARRKQNELFLERTFPEVVCAKLEAMGLERDRDYALELVERYPTREIVVQHDETDLAFVSRLCEHVGITLLLEHTQGRDVVVLSDTPSSFHPIRNPRLPQRHQREHPAVWGVTTHLRRVPAQAIVRDYNYRSPSAPLGELARTEASGATGLVVDLGPHVKTPDEAKLLARVRAEELATGHYRVLGTTSEMSLRAGGLVTLTGPGEDRELLVTEAEHSFARQVDGAATSSWESHFVAIPAEQRFRPARKTPWPRVPSLANATVDGAIRGDYAELDEHGRYHLRLATDRSGRSDLGATHPVRMMQPHAGANYGMHFPLRPGAEVLVGFVNGDPDRAIIVGAAPNPAVPSPVALANQTQNVLRTGSANELVMEDARGIERIRLHTPHARTTLQLGSSEEAEQGALVTTQANLSLAARLTSNEATAQKTVFAGSFATLVGQSVVVTAGPAFGARRGRAGPRSAERDLARRPRARPSRPSPSPRRSAPKPAPPAKRGESDASGGGLWSALGGRLREAAESAGFEGVRAAARATDGGLERAIGRSSGQAPGRAHRARGGVRGGADCGPSWDATRPLVFGDRTASLSSFDTASVSGERLAQLKSPGTAELAGGQATQLTSAGELNAEAALVRIVAGYYPEAEAPSARRRDVDGPHEPAGPAPLERRGLHPGLCPEERHLHRPHRGHAAAREEDPVAHGGRDHGQRRDDHLLVERQHGGESGRGHHGVRGGKRRHRGRRRPGGHGGDGDHRGGDDQARGQRPRGWRSDGQRPAPGRLT
jgi:type VI secretion system VgrG family protein